MLRITIALATLTLLVAAGLRITHLHNLPPGPHYDEAANLIITRTVAFGGARYFPMVENYQGREVLYYYLSAPLLWLVQDSRFALQLVGVFSNMLLVATTITLGRLMFGGRRGMVIGLAAGVVAAVSLPQVLLARQAFRAITLPMMQGLALVLLWRGLQTRRRSWLWLVAGGVFAGAAVYTYNSSRLFPVWLAVAGLALLAVSAGQRRRRLAQGAAFFVPLVLIALPFAIYAVQKPDIFLGRLYEVTAADSAVTLTESVQRHTRMFFLKGEDLLRYNPRGRPYFTLLEGGLLLVGLAAAAWTSVQRGVPAPTRAAGVLLLLSPLMVLPSVISTGGLPPNHMRSIAMTPLIFVVVGLGYERLSRLFRREWVTYAGLILALIAGAGVTARDYFAWATRADLYYATDADLAAAAQWAQATLPAGVPVYIAARDRFHPTVQAFETQPIRWLGTETLFIPPESERVVIFPRSAPPPEDWQHWLDDTATRAEGIPTAPDGQPAFDAYVLTAGAPLPAEGAEVAPTRNAYLTLMGGHSSLALPAGRVTVQTAWQIDRPPIEADLSPLVHMEDSLGNLIAHAESPSNVTNTWEAGETLLQRVPGLRVPIGTPPGVYPLKMIWVAHAEERYLPYSTLDGQFAGVWADAGHIEVLRPNAFPPPEDVAMDERANIDVAEGVRLLGWNTLPTEARPGERIPVTLHWAAVPAATRERISYEMRLTDDAGTHALTLNAPLLDAHPSDGWVDGQLMTERLVAEVGQNQPAGDYAIALDVNETTVMLGRTAIVGITRHYEPPPVMVTFREVTSSPIQLYGCSLQRSQGILIVELAWHMLDNVHENFTVFIHLIDDNGTIISQRDTMPQNNAYPTSLWAKGEYVLDEHTLPEPDVDYTVVVGMYSQQTGQRLLPDQDAPSLECKP